MLVTGFVAVAELTRGHSVILIPSPGGLKVDEWAVSASNTQLRSSSGANVLSFDYPLAVGDTFTWSGYLKHGYELVDALSILCEEADTKVWVDHADCLEGSQAE